MLLSDFPQEIIIKLTDFLPLNDKVSCSLVCKAWQQIFQDSLHSVLVIESNETLEALADPLHTYQHTHRDTGHLVRHLYVNHHLNATDKDIFVLQNTFQNIKHLHLEAGYLVPISLGITADWHLWRLLRELHISLNNLPMPDTKNVLLEIVLRLPLLKRLEIINRMEEPNLIVFSLNDLETIHSNLNYLGHLKLSSDLLTISQTDLERMSKILPAPKMASLTITSTETDYLWLCYFARKYPNLHTFDFCSLNYQATVEQQSKDAVSLFQKVPLPFQRLRKLNIEYTNCLGKECLFIWNMSKHLKIPLKHISISVKVAPATLRSLDRPAELAKHITELYLSEYSSTVESFSLKYKEKKMIPMNLMAMRESLCDLIELEITTPVLPIELDTLLETIPCLKSLSLGFTQIDVKDELYDSRRFGLQSLKIRAANIASNVLRFISFHCRSLSALSLVRTAVSGHLSTPGCQFIDMTYIRLKSLNIQNTHFIIKYKNACPDILNVTLITRPIEDIPPKQEYDPKVLPVVVGGKPIKACYRWFYKDRLHIMKNISKGRGSSIEKSIISYEGSTGTIKTDALDSPKTYPYFTWSNNNVFGYTKIKLGYVSDCIIETF